MTFEELKEKAKKMGYNEGEIVVNGIVWLNKNNGDFDLCFSNEGEVLLSGDEEYILAKDKTPDQMFVIMEVLQWGVEV